MPSAQSAVAAAVLLEQYHFGNFDDT